MQSTVYWVCSFCMRTTISTVTIGSWDTGRITRAIADPTRHLKWCGSGLKLHLLKSSRVQAAYKHSRYRAYIEHMLHSLSFIYRQFNRQKNFGGVDVEGFPLKLVFVLWSSNSWGAYEYEGAEDFCTSGESASNIAIETDRSMFRAISSNQYHVLHPLFPPNRYNSY